MNNSKANSSIDSFVFLLKQDEAIAFEALFRLFYDKLLHISKGYLVNHEDAEEIVQNVFLRLWERKNSLKKITHINNYLYTMTKNACLDQIKHEKIKTSYSRDSYDRNRKLGIQYRFIKDEAASLLLESELEKKITEGIELLPEKCKKVFIKSRKEGMKHREIADLFNISKRTVDNHISFALKHMRLHLRDFLTLLLAFFSV